MNTTKHLTVLNDTLVLNDAWYPGEGVMAADGTIALRCGLKSGLMAKGNAVMVSRDKGKTWEQRPDDVLPGGPSIWMRDGSLAIIDAKNTVESMIHPAQDVIPYIAAIRRAPSLDSFLDKKYAVSFSVVNIPELSGGEGDGDDFYCGLIQNGVVEMPNGDILLTMYGHFKSDRERIPYFTKKAYRCRSWVVRSTDGGKTFSYLATIGSDEILRLPALAEGYCEPDMILTGDNALLAVMRSGGAPFRGTRERYTGLYTTLSSDAGVTWSTPKPISDFGVWPELLKMSNGVIVCASGRPGVFLQLSLDGGKTFTEPDFVTDFDSDWGRCSGGYCTIFEIEPGVLALFYDDVTDKDNDHKLRTHFIRMRTFSVTP